MPHGLPLVPEAGPVGGDEVVVAPPQGPADPAGRQPGALVTLVDTEVAVGGVEVPGLGEVLDGLGPGGEAEPAGQRQASVPPLAPAGGQGHRLDLLRLLGPVPLRQQLLQGHVH